MSDPTPRYYFPTAPGEYDQSFMNEIVRAFSLFQEQLKNPGKVTAHSLNLKPSDTEGIQQYSNNREAYDAGLLPGDIWMLSTGEIRIVVSPNVDVPVSIEYYRSAEGQVGQVITFDASAEIGEIINPIAGYVGEVNAASFYNVTSPSMFAETLDVTDGIIIPNTDTDMPATGPLAEMQTTPVFIDSDNNAVVSGSGAQLQIGSIELSLGHTFDAGTPDYGMALVGDIEIIYGIMPSGQSASGSVGSVEFEAAAIVEITSGVVGLGSVASQAASGSDILVDGVSVL